MKPLDQPEDLQRYYKDSGVVDAYMDKRTAQPLNGVLHRRQVDFLNRVIAEHSPEAVLEVACGPGRLTTAVHGFPFGVAVDSSPTMLAKARARMGNDGRSWSLLRSDAFVLPFRSRSFDLAYTLRFVRHFQLDERLRLYAEFKRVLRPEGCFVVDALNRDVSYPHRLRRGLQRYEIYDVLYTRQDLEQELEEAGFRVVRVEGIIKHFAVQRTLNRLRRVHLGGAARRIIAALERLPGDNPSTWMVVARSRS
jgi:SAM-dependent methyltransferase